MRLMTKHLGLRHLTLALLIGLLGCGARGDAASTTVAPTDDEAAATTEEAVAWTPPTDRTYLPIPQPARRSYTELDARDVDQPDPPPAVAAPEGAPNVIVILIDDIGFGVPSSFGGAVDMPNLDQLADSGLRFNHFHTTALCSPTRVALQTGRNHHAANAGAIMEIATAFPGNSAVRPDSIATLPEILRLNGYSTAAFGKYHETPPWQVSVSGPLAQWPTRSGYEKFYGFIGGETNQWHPAIYDGDTLIDPSVGHEGYHFTEDMTDQAIGWMRAQQSLTPDKPFFMYYAPGAVHAPHHVPAEWIEKYSGRFDAGWDVYREQTLARQIELGIVPEGTELAPKPDDIADWDTLSADEKRLFSRQMEIFAAFSEHTDHYIGELLEALEATGDADNTLVLAVIGDNGSSAEGGMVGLFNEMEYFNGVVPTVADVLPHINELGGPDSYGHMAAGWAVAGATPFTWTKQMASDFGGTRNPLIVHWPARFTGDGSVRTQFHHVTDIAPTVLAAANLPEPTWVNGTRQRPMDGASMLYALTDAAASTQHPTQYFEMFGNRAIYHEGWFARVIHFFPWAPAPVRPLADDVWELYDTGNDFSLRNDLASQEPERLAALQALFQSEAVRNHVLPIDDRKVERFDSAVAGRPDLIGTRTSLTVFPGMHMTENSFINIKNRSFTVTAHLAIEGRRPNGVLLAQAGQFGGWATYLSRGVPVFTYNFLGTDIYRIRARRALRSTETEVTFEFVYDGDGRGKGGTVRIKVGDEVIGEGRVEQTQPNVFSADETIDVGEDLGTPVDSAYGPAPGNELQGAELERVTVEIH